MQNFVIQAWELHDTIEAVCEIWSPRPSMRLSARLLGDACQRVLLDAA